MALEKMMILMMMQPHFAQQCHLSKLNPIMQLTLKLLTQKDNRFNFANSPLFDPLSN